MRLAGRFGDEERDEDEGAIYSVFLLVVDGLVVAERGGEEDVGCVVDDGGLGDETKS